MIFLNTKHQTEYENLIQEILEHKAKLDEYHFSLAYLLTLDRVCREHIKDLYDFNEDIILKDGLNKSWQTGTSRKTTLLAFNLWNDFDESNDSIDKNEITPSNIFSCEYAPYYYEAIKLRFPDYCN